MLRNLILQCLSHRGPGTHVESLIPRVRRKGFKVADYKATLMSLRVDGTVEQIGQYLWLTKERECQSTPVQLSSSS